MGTAFEVYITNIYFPHIEKKSLVMLEIHVTMATTPSNCLKYAWNTIFRAKFLLAENQVGLFTIQHLVNTCQKKLRLWSTFYVTMETKNRTISGYTLHVICKVVCLLSATVHINRIYKFEIIHIKSSNANKTVILCFEFSLLWQSKCQTVSFHT